MEFSIRSSDGEASQVAIFVSGYQSGANGGKGDPDLISFYQHRLIYRPGIDNIFPISHSAGSQAQAIAEIFLVFRMDVVGVSDVDGGGDSGFGQSQGFHLGLPEFRPGAFSRLLCFRQVVGELDD